MSVVIDSTSRKHRHNAKIRARILKAATELIRSEGPNAVTIDRLMASAGLTRGAFYAHFPSKAALVEEVFGEDTVLKRLLEQRSAACRGSLEGGRSYLLRAYLNKEHFGDLRKHCGLLALTPTVAGASPQAKDTYIQTLERTLRELRRASPNTPAISEAQSRGILLILLGLSVAAEVDRAEDRRTAYVDAAQRAVQHLLRASKSAP